MSESTAKHHAITLAAIVRSQHETLDYLMARLALADRDFFPSKHPKLWQSITDAHSALVEFDRSVKDGQL